MQNDGEALEYALRAGRALENLLQKEAAAAKKFKEALDGLDSKIRDAELTERLYDALNELLGKNKELSQLLSHDITKEREQVKTPKFAKEETDLEKEIRKTKEQLKTMARDKSKPFDLDKAMERAKLECKLDKLIAQMTPGKPVKVVEHDLVR